MSQVMLQAQDLLFEIYGIKLKFHPQNRYN